MNNQPCPLCSEKAKVFLQNKYAHCPNCDLIFLLPDFHLNQAAEKAQYDLHQNSPTDHRYRQFLNQLAEPLMALCPPPAQMLDFGCGPGPTLSVMFTEQGYDISLYDPYYAADDSVLEKSYRVITLTEVLEHMATPRQELQKLTGMLQPQGYLGIMTSLHHGVDNFADWHYKNDPTHICFYSDQTIQWIAGTFSWQVEHLDERVIIFKK